MNDLISRQAAVESMANAIWHYSNDLYKNLNSYEMAKGLAEDGLMFLPSADPVQPQSDLISREDAIQTFIAWGLKEFGYHDLNRNDL